MSEQRTQDDTITEKPADTKPCPICGETIKAGAKKCIHCNEFIEKTAEKPADTKPCPVCREPIKLEAQKCIHCNEFIEKYKPTSQSDWKKITKWDLVKIILLILIGVVIRVYRQELTYSWLAGAGLVLLLILLILEKYVRSHAPKVTAIGEGTTIWDLGKVLLVPIVLAIGSFLLADFQERRQNAIEDRRIAAQSTVEADRSNENALQTYFDRMADLLIVDKLRTSEPEAEVRDVAQTRTLTVLRRLDPERKGALLLFLHEAELITGTAIIDLHRADLRGAILGRADLGGADLREAYLFEADLRQADLRRAILREVIVDGVYLGTADLVGANLVEADLRGTALYRVDLRGADLSQADLRGAKYSNETKWPGDFDPSGHGAINMSEQND
jgi:hypothetical protein